MITLDASAARDFLRRVVRPLVMAAVALGVLSIAVLAGAYWTENGAGSATISVGALATPTNIVATATAGNATVPVTWAGVTAPDGGPVDGYYVQRYSGATPSAACASSPSALLAASATNCNDASVPDGTYTYRVTAVFRTWTADSASSNAVTVDAVASFTVAAPASATAGTSFTITVTAKDQANKTITGYRGTVHFVTSDPNGAVVPADYTFTGPDAGTHTFTNVVTLETTPSQTITVNDTTDPTTTGTKSVTVKAGAATKLAFTTQPGGGTGGIAWAAQPVVKVQDAAGNTVTSSSASITLAIDTNPGGGTLSCTANPKSAGSGVATFASCKITLSGTGYTLTAAAAGLTTATSNTFNITVGAATKLAFTTQPGGGTGGTAWAAQPVVKVQDAGGNVVTSSNASITLAIGTNPGGGTLSCTTNPLAATAGVATFTGCKITLSGTGYTLTAAAAGLTTATSNTFNITVGAATKLAFTTQPGGGTGGTAWAAQPVVKVQDAGGNMVTSSNASITLAIGTNPGGGTLSCTTNPLAATAGVATFTGCKITLSGTGYTLTAAAAGLTTATSNTFKVTVGAAAQLAFTTQPGGGAHGVAWGTQPVVKVQDAGGNVVTSSSASITLAIGTNPGGGTLSCTTNPKTAVSGVATFAGCKITLAGAGYTLTATSGALTAATSNTFNIT